MKAYLPGDEISFKKNPDETVEDICADFLVPGFLQNRLISDPDHGPAFAAKSREVMRMACDYLVVTPSEAEARGGNGPVITAMFDQNKLLIDFAAIRMTALVQKVIEEGIEKHVKYGVGDEEIPEEFKKLHEEFSESVDDKTTVHAARVFGPLGKLLDRFISLAGGVEEFSRIQLDASELLRERIKGVQPEVALLITMAGTVTSVLQKRMIEQDRFIDAFKGFESTLIAARDMTTAITLTADVPVASLMAMRLSSLVSDVLESGKDDKGAQEDKPSEPAGVAESNVINFPASKTVH